jgi:hypothetical protein
MYVVFVTKLEEANGEMEKKDSLNTKIKFLGNSFS